MKAATDSANGIDSFYWAGGDGKIRIPLGLEQFPPR